MDKYLRRTRFWSLAIRDVLACLANFRLWQESHILHPGPISIRDDFVGVNIATSADPRCDDYVIERLKELNIRHVRMDYSYSSSNSYAERLLERLLELDFDVLLDLFPPMHEAQRLPGDGAVQDRWERFCREVFAKYRGRVKLFEIGSTPNRGRWSGFDTRGFAVAWQIAYRAAQPHDVKLAGPNVSDFEPLYNALFLAAMCRSVGPPDVHTDNLFVERVREPEAFDHRVLGRLGTNLLRLNLVKKARVIHRIGRQHGINNTMCTYTCWTTKRLNRYFGDPQAKKVDYLVRYLVLATLSGALERVYWGPLICSRDGLIDDKTDDYPDIDQVSFYREVRGMLENFSPTPSFYALAFLRQRLSGSRCLQAVSAANGLSHFVFESSQGEEFHLCWCRDRQVFALEDLYRDRQLEGAQFRNARGDLLTQGSRMVTEHPLYIEFEGGDSRPILPRVEDLAAVSDYGKGRTVFINSVKWQTEAWQSKAWVGAFALDRDLNPDLGSALAPPALQQLAELDVLRDARNRIWNIAHPGNDSRRLSVKLNRVRGIKRITYRFALSKGKRHWNNACEMLHRGISTPPPVAFYEQRNNASTEDSYYLCEYIADTFTTRDVYAAFRAGEDNYRGLSKDGWLELIARFVCLMHNRRVLHRDLSAGNILYTENEGSFTPWLIDIGRAEIHHGSISRTRRLTDLMRICYKLDWEDRRRFVEHYGDALGTPLPWYWRLAMLYYDFKQGSKKSLKRKR